MIVTLAITRPQYVPSLSPERLLSGDVVMYDDSDDTEPLSLYRPLRHNGNAIAHLLESGGAELVSPPLTPADLRQAVGASEPYHLPSRAESARPPSLRVLRLRRLK